MSLLLAIVSGSLMVAGLTAMLLVRRPIVPRLGAAFEVLDGRRPQIVQPEPGVGRLGAWLRQRAGFATTPETRRRLRMVGRSSDRHLAYKAVGALAGLVLPTAVGGWVGWLCGDLSPIPLLFGVAGAACGFIVPDLWLRQRDRVVSLDATEALLAFFDLVTLERLANRSGAQALRAAASVSRVTVFREIAEVLERAQLEQRAPYADLRKLGIDLALPALVDIADVMRLDESGASLSGALRARVRELRDAQLAALRLQAAEVSERMGALMVIPTLEFGLLFLVPPILRLLST